jgi:23S rRNA (uracil1939-C5)-methyltransferase
MEMGRMGVDSGSSHQDGGVSVPDVEISGVAAGGEGVGRLPGGQAVFVRGALPGERVTVQVVEAKARFARAELVQVRVPSPARVVPPCPVLAAGCGGCAWQHVAPAAQRDLKATIVGDALRRIGKLGRVPDIDPGPDLPTTAYRTTVRAAVVDGRAGFHRHHGHDVVALGADGCLVAHPLVDEVLRLAVLGDASAVTVRAGAATGERLAVVEPAAAGVEVPPGVQVTGADELAAGHRAWIHEEVAGRRFRISAESFFQARPDGAAALAELVVSAALAGFAGAGGARPRVADLYGGVGLLGGVLADRASAAGRELRLQVVEANRSAVADARANLADVADARIVRADVRRWRPSAVDVVVADPSRHGLGAEVVSRIAATGAATMVLVSCDPAALGRDAGLLDASGYELVGATLVDLFAHTPHVEVVTHWRARAHRPGSRHPGRVAAS